jgi:excisionase family DNA binding protein
MRAAFRRTFGPIRYRARRRPNTGPHRRSEEGKNNEEMAMAADGPILHPRRLREDPPTPGELLTVAGAADRLGVPVRFIRRLIAERRIRFYKIGRYVRIDGHDLDAFIAAGRIDPPQRRQ